MDNKDFSKINVMQKETKVVSFFDGKFIDYIGYKLLAFLITIITFTIAKPWADILVIEYKVNHTIYNGKRLKFEGKGTSLFVLRLKWILLSIITLGIYSWWIPLNMEKWTISNTHFENENFTKEASSFDGKLFQMIGVNVVTYLLTVISLGLFYPFAVCYKQKWIAKHTIINGEKLVFNGKSNALLSNYLLWWFLSIITFGIYGLWLPIKVYGWQVANTHIKLEGENEESISVVPMIICGVIATITIIVSVIFISKINLTIEISDIFDKLGFTQTPENTVPSQSIDYLNGDSVSYIEYHESNAEYNTTGEGIYTDPITIGDF